VADERDPGVSQRYRDLGAEEPPRELDQTILAAARRAAQEPHAPLVTPAGKHRWYFALGAAAILLLAVGITLHLERDRPDPETMPGYRAQEERSAAPTAASPPPSSADTASSRGEARSQGAMQARREKAPAPGSQPDTPERWLERIVQLRKEGRNEEAERQLAEFRRKYPDYRIPTSALK
jgi:hypothetical protein